MFEELKEFFKDNFIGSNLLIEINGAISSIIDIDDIKEIWDDEYSIHIEGCNRNFSLDKEEIETIDYESEDNCDLFIEFKNGLGLLIKILEVE